MTVLLSIPCTALSICLLFAITRLTGSRQISSMTVYEYINGITLGSLAAELCINTGKEFWAILIAVLLYGAFTIFCAIYTNRNRAFRRFLAGVPVVLMEKGKLYRRNFARARMDIEELCAHLRAMGYFDITQLESIVMESTGQLSVQPRAANRPLTPSDMKLPMQNEGLLCNFIVDGQILDANLKKRGHDRDWLQSSLTLHGYHSADEVFLCCEKSNDSSLACYPKEEQA